jgi:hypothetical protein
MTQQLPAYLLKRQSRATTEDLVSGIGSSLPPHLSIANNRFALVDGSGNEKLVPTFHLDICIIGSNNNVSRVFYDPAKKFDPKGGDNTPPLCFSDNGVGPSRQSSMPQAPTCAVCPHAEWGSAVSAMTGRGIPACQSGKKVAFIVPGDADEIVYFLKVPPASLKNLQKYVKTLAANTIGGRAAEPPDVITRLEFESQGVLKFSPVSLVDEDTFNRTEQVYATDAIAQVTGRDDVAIDPSRQLAAPVQTNGALAGPQPQRMAPPAPGPAPLNLPGQGQVIPPAQQAQQAANTGDIPDFLRNQQQAAQTAQQVLQEPAKPKGTRKKAVEAAAPIPDNTTAVPGFLQRTQEAPPTANFGMVNNAPPPSNDVNEALQKAFALPGV